MTENTTMLINLSQSALSTALDELESAKKMLQWSRDKLVETQQENRKICNLLLRFAEFPDPADCSKLLNELDKPCGFIDCGLTKSAAKIIREYAASNAYLLEENRRLQHVAHPR